MIHLTHHTLILIGIAIVALIIGLALIGVPPIPLAIVIVVGIGAFSYLAYTVFRTSGYAEEHIDTRLKILNAIGTAKNEIEPGGRGVVYVNGEEWTADNVGKERINAGDKVMVMDYEGLILKVIKYKEDMNNG